MIASGHALTILDRAAGFSEDDNDDALLCAAALRELRVAGASLTYATLLTDPDAFLRPPVWDALEADGDDALPLTLCDGKVVKSGVYPTPEELSAWTGVLLMPLSTEKERRLLAAEAREAASCGGCAGCGGRSKCHAHLISKED